MKAIVIHAPKDLRVEERDTPKPGPGEVQIELASGGICGSDLHYYHNGGFSTVRLKEPMILGHEVSGYISRLGEGVEGLFEGQLVAVSPSRPCGSCRYCKEGLNNQCLNMQFYGSAMPFPHIQGAFSEILVANANQCVLAEGLTAGEAAMAEPLAVTLHATRRLGSLLGKRVLVTGCGPIGILSILSARRAGATEIVATDLSNFTLDMAKQMGADQTINMVESPGELSHYFSDKGYFDVLYECSGAEPAVKAGINALRPRGLIAQVGLGGDMSLPMMAMTAKELELRGCFRFHEEFATGIELMRKGLIDVKPLITNNLPISRVVEAFELAGDRHKTIKMQINFQHRD